jgi:hypothetical protein
LAEPESLGSIIARGKVPGPKKKKQKLSLIATNWEHLAGRRLAEHSRPTSLARGTILVAADSPAWAAELTMVSEKLLASARKLTGDQAVKKIRIQSRQAGTPGSQEGSEEARDADLANGSEDLPMGNEIQAVADENVRKALARMVLASKAGKQSERDRGPGD